MSRVSYYQYTAHYETPSVTYAEGVLMLSFQQRNNKNKQYPNGYCLFLVRETGLEPVRVAPHAPQTCASADSATLANYVVAFLATVNIIAKVTFCVKRFFKKVTTFFDNSDCGKLSPINTAPKSLNITLNPFFL